MSVALAGAFGGQERAGFLGLVAAVVLLDWIVVQAAVIGCVSFLQPLFFAGGLVIFALAWHVQRQIG
jgi:hypothetical protein